MGCIHTSNSNKSRITIRVMELKYSILRYWRDRHFPSSRVRGDPSFPVIEG